MYAMWKPRRPAAADVVLATQAADGIQRLLERPPAYTDALLPLLLPSEVEEIAEHSQNPLGAVAIAALIYHARLRLALQEAGEHHATIQRTVPYDASCVVSSVGTPGRGIREVRSPEARSVDSDE
jgi:hypothetical protein